MDYDYILLCKKESELIELKIFKAFSFLKFQSKLKMKKNCILISCGSFNPPTIMHLRLFELAKDHLQGCGWNVLDGMISPAHDNYKRMKPSLTVSSNHRVKMIELALQSYDFVRCTKWESEQDDWTRTRDVLEEHQKQINQVLDVSFNHTEKFPHLPDSLVGLNSDKKKEPNAFKLFMVCGGDLLESFSVPNLWTDEDIEVMVRDFGLIVTTQRGSNPGQYVEEHAILNQYKDNIYILDEKIPTAISSTKIREAVKIAIRSNSMLTTLLSATYRKINYIFECFKFNDIH